MHTFGGCLFTRLQKTKNSFILWFITDFVKTNKRNEQISRKEQPNTFLRVLGYSFHSRIAVKASPFV